jgi:hypothetical protein
VQGADQHSPQLEWPLPNLLHTVTIYLRCETAEAAGTQRRTDGVGGGLPRDTGPAPTRCWARELIIME